MKDFAQYKLASLAPNQSSFMCAVCFSLVGCSKYEQQAETIDVAYHLHGLWARNAAQVWAVGDDGDFSIRRTGEHWAKNWNRSGTDFIYGSDSQLWIVGAAGTILHSKDDGEHWEPQKSETRLQLSSVYAGASQLWIVGDNGTILQSADGGQNWQPKTSGTESDLSSVYASGSQLWTVGENGIVLHSTDGGQQLAQTMEETVSLRAHVGGRLAGLGRGRFGQHPALGRRR